MRFRLRTLLMVLALGPVGIAGTWFAWLLLLEHKLVFAFLMVAGYLALAIALPLCWPRRP